VEEVVDPFWRRPGPDPPPDFVRTIKERFLPLLDQAGLEERMDARFAELRAELRTELEALAREAFATPLKARRRKRR
jgi:hypothetical protein